MKFLRTRFLVLFRVEIFLEGRGEGGERSDNPVDERRNMVLTKCP